METGSAPPEASDGYPGAAVVGAVLATLFFPLISLIAALLLHGGQTDPRKKAQLRTWAWATGGLLVFELVIALVFISSVTVS